MKYFKGVILNPPILKITGVRVVVKTFQTILKFNGSNNKCEKHSLRRIIIFRLEGDKMILDAIYIPLSQGNHGKLKGSRKITM